METAIAVAAIVDAIIAIVLLIWWVFWSSRMLALTEKATNMAGQRLEFAREAAIELRALNRRLAE